jgi:thioredoxin
LDNGWEEIAARTALRIQFTIQQRINLGINDTFSRETLDQIRPSFRLSANKLKENQEGKATKQARSASASAATTKKSAASSTAAEPKPAKKEDVVFDVNANNFQKIVLESPVPVLVDVYADWCGPCKQLGPMLEQAAIKAGGLFRLAKINSDKERGIAEALQVQGLPTVFSAVKGKLNDRFVGLLPGEQIQEFLVRAVTGYGKRVQGDQIDDRTLNDLTMRIQMLAGMASIGFKKKASLHTLVEQALQEEDAFVIPPGTKKIELAEGVQKAMNYILNARNDISVR